VTGPATPLLDRREAADIVAELMRRREGYTPEWKPAAGGPGWALMQVYARQLHSLIERLGQMPDRLQLALLEMLGMSLLTAQAARAPLVFTPVPRAPDSVVPARTRVGAQLPGHGDPLVFETESPIALVSARLAEAVTVWPGRGGYADHSRDALGGQPFTLFEPLQPVAHALYLAHDANLVLTGHATVDIRFELPVHGSAPLPWTWEYRDGEDWRPFKPFMPAAEAAGSADSVDGTDGLTRSGVVRLVADCAQTARRKIAGVDSYWIRARMAQPLPYAPDRVWPSVASVLLRSVVLNPLHRLALAEARQGAAGGAGSSVQLRLVGRTDAGTAELTGPGYTLQLPLAMVGSQAVAPVLEADWLRLPPGSYRLHVDHPAFTPFDHAFVVAEGTQWELVLAPGPQAGGVEATSAFADSVKLDLHRAFLPFGPAGQAGNCFYLRSDEAFCRPQASIALTAAGVNGPGPGLDLTKSALSLVAETWNGERWQGLAASGDELLGLFTQGYSEARIELPPRVAPTEVGGEKGYWLRIRIAAGAFANVRAVKINTTGDSFSFIEQAPKALENLRIGYRHSPAPGPAQHCLSCNDFEWRDHSADACRQGTTFEPYTPAIDVAPALYLGFDAALPAGVLSLYFDVQESGDEPGRTALQWEGWDGADWQPLAHEDETQALTVPGMVALQWPGTPAATPAAVLTAKGSQVQLADARDAGRFLAGDRQYIEREGIGELVTVAGVQGALLMLATPLDADYVNATIAPARWPRFGTPRTWVRARLQQAAQPRQTVLKGVHLNAVWAAQQQSFDAEILGSSNGEPDQSFFTRQRPVLPGQVIEVRELDGSRAAVELPLLLQDLRAHGLSERELRTVTDPRSGRVSQVWVTWREQPHLHFSRPGDRHYVVERSTGRIGFGDSRHGRIPLPGTDNVQARAYCAGGGIVGNVPAGTIKSVLSGVLAQGVTNPVAAEGGADGEPTASALARGPMVLRHRRQALVAADYEALAREASPAVAVARALLDTHPSGRPARGWIRLMVMPHSAQARPQPSYELRRRVRDFVIARMPASAAGQLSVGGPEYHGVGVNAALKPRELRLAGETQAAALAALQRFLHPLGGGPDGTGWQFGRGVHLSDVAALLELVPGIDHVRTLELTLDGTPRGEVVPVPDNRIVVAGPLRVTLAEG
jgi:hypothetical protein